MTNRKNRIKKARNISRNNKPKVNKLMDSVLSKTGKELTFARMKHMRGIPLSEREQELIEHYNEIRQKEIGEDEE